jgi:8-oxo-dGTP pyrophosphatase MutT (NUDIX family)
MSRSLSTLLARRLLRPLPGRIAHAQFEPELSYGRHYDPPGPSFRPAAVLALLYPVEGQWFLPLTLRPVHMFDHAGQISFPGGMVEPGESTEAAAVREFVEELGIDPPGLHMLGPLSPISLYSTRFAITPWLAIASERPAMMPNPCEVAAVLETPLADLLNRDNYGQHIVQRGGLRFSAPHIVIQGHRIWGATALILGELISLFHDAQSAL